GIRAAGGRQRRLSTGPQAGARRPRLAWPRRGGAPGGYCRRGTPSSPGPPPPPRARPGRAPPPPPRPPGRPPRPRDGVAPGARGPLDERLPVLARAAALLRKRRDELARLATLEMGKTIAAAEAEVEKCAWVCDHYAQHASFMLAAERVTTEASDSHVRFDPL